MFIRRVSITFVAALLLSILASAQPVSAADPAQTIDSLVEGDHLVEENVEGDLVVNASVEGDLVVEGDIKGDLKIDDDIAGDIIVNGNVEGSVITTSTNGSVSGDIVITGDVGGDINTVNVDGNVEGDVIIGGTPAKPEPEDDASLLSNEEIEQLRHEAYVSDYEVSVEEASRRLNLLPELKSLTSEIETLESERFAGRAIVHEPTFGAQVYLVGDEPVVDHTRHVMESHDDVHIVYGATHTLAELREIVDSPYLFQALSEETKGSIVATGLDTAENAIVVEIDDPAKIDVVQHILNANNDPEIIVKEGRKEELENLDGGELVQTAEGS